MTDVDVNWVYLFQFIDTATQLGKPFIVVFSLMRHSKSESWDFMEVSMDIRSKLELLLLLFTPPRGASDPLTLRLYCESGRSFKPPPHIGGGELLLFTLGPMGAPTPTPVGEPLRRGSEGDTCMFDCCCWSEEQFLTPAAALPAEAPLEAAAPPMLLDGTLLLGGVVGELRGDLKGKELLRGLLWVLVCLERWSLRMNRRSHNWHTNFFSPVQNKKKHIKLFHQLLVQ